MMIQGSCLSRGSDDEEREHLLSASVEHEQQKISVQCVDDPEPTKCMVYYNNETFTMTHHPPISVQCVDDPVPLKPMVYNDDAAFPMYHHPPMSFLL
ncbi:hypothetical protein HF521_005749 [Silurus meridionalis]|uniref:Uncharacterized protein n=1 Tax=Silurus meridionalis TaxID=175797 RepID=A0A8T0AXB3_SILME|nr:hypothetical protein HF521_005749 [Silurus meridionalis]